MKNYCCIKKITVSIIAAVAMILNSVVMEAAQTDEFVSNVSLKDDFLSFSGKSASGNERIDVFLLNAGKTVDDLNAAVTNELFKSAVNYCNVIQSNSNGNFSERFQINGMEKIDWYSKPYAWPVILTITSVWKNVGMDSVVYYASLMGIDTSLIEAAEVDGANKVQRTIHIILPSLIPLVTILTILKIGGIFRADFGLFYTVTQDGASGNLYETTKVIDTYIFRTFKDNSVGDAYGLTSAVGLLQSVVGWSGFSAILLGLKIISLVIYFLRFLPEI